MMNIRSLHKLFINQNIKGKKNKCALRKCFEIL